MTIHIDPSDTRAHRYKVIALDVWGHGPDEHEKYDCRPNEHGDYTCDGYTVNAAYYTGRTVEVKASRCDYNLGTSFASSEYHAEDSDIVRALVEAGELTPDCATEHIEVDGEDDDLLFVNRLSDGKPLLQLERTQDSK